MAKIVYDADFYRQTLEGVARSARTIVPMLIKHFPIRSAVDFGCGCGAWLRALEENGITDVTGYDGDYVDRSLLLIDPTKFMSVDLQESFEIDRTFDLAISLEVAEHLPGEFAEALIRRLVRVAPAVLFSAAIPGQGGICHVNEQWQDYWRNIFKSFDFHPIDLIRPAIWGRPDIEFWYQQNIILYCSGVFLKNTHLQKVPDNVSLNSVHPCLYEVRLAKPELSLRGALKTLPTLMRTAIVRRMKIWA